MQRYKVAERRLEFSAAVCGLLVAVDRFVAIQRSRPSGLAIPLLIILVLLILARVTVQYLDKKRREEETGGDA